MYVFALLLPFFSFLGSFFFGRFLGSKGTSLLTTGSVFLTFFLSLIMFFEIGLQDSPCFVDFGCWFTVGIISVNWNFLFDSLTSIMFCVVSLVSAFVHLYSIEYMGLDPHFNRFMSYLSLFTGFMLVLVSANSFIQMFIGWEGIGLASFLLINFWFSRLQANKSAIKAVLVNRIGDFGLLFAMVFIFVSCNSLNYQLVFLLMPFLKDSFFSFFSYTLYTIDLITFFLFLGVVGKSAQIGLHTWLPDAMEAPTPVSALLHAATLVTAGVFLLARCSFLFEFSSFSLSFVVIFGGLTTFLAASIGLVQNDIKRVIAYSTASQLGYMVFISGLSNYSISVFHLANHAVFKALLFLAAGCVLHSVNDEQDLRKLGGLIDVLPLTYSMVFIGSLALIGFPFLTGFYSKDLILEVAFAQYNMEGCFSFFLGTLTAFLTSFYSFRLLILAFLLKPKLTKKTFELAHESSWKMFLPLLLLAIGSLFLGFVLSDLFVGFGTPFFSFCFFVHPFHSIGLDCEFIPLVFKLLPFILTLFGGFLAFNVFIFQKSLFSKIVGSKLVRAYFTFFSKKWFFDKFYNQTVNQFFLFHGFLSTYLLDDRGFLEIFGSFGISGFFYGNCLFIFQKFHTGLLYHYSFLILFSLFTVVFFYGSFVFIIQNSIFLVFLLVLLL